VSKIPLRNLKEKSVYFFSMMISKVINGNKSFRGRTFHNILCIREDEIGDLCYSLHVFKSLKKQFPDAVITLLCRPFAVPLVKNDPNIALATSNWNDLSGKYDLIVDLRGSGKSNWYALTHLPGFRVDRGTIRYRNMLKGDHPHEVITNLQVIAPVLDEGNRILEPEFFFNNADIKKADDFLLRSKINEFTVLHIGARRELRKWPLKNFAALAVYLKMEKQFDVIFCGDKNDLKSIEQTRQIIPFKTYSVAGDFTLSEFSSLVSKSSLFVGNESGPLHIASVAGTPSLGLFGPGEPHVFYPLGKKTDFLHHVLECNPCDQVHCVHPDNPCIDRITMEEVKIKIESLLKK
jgi:ADP-heptose:LPS heptosyltransferase